MVYRVGYEGHDAVYRRRKAQGALGWDDASAYEEHFDELRWTVPQLGDGPGASERTSDRQRTGFLAWTRGTPIYHLQPLRSCLMCSRFPESSISVASRRFRVPSRFALVTQRAACLR